MKQSGIDWIGEIPDDWKTRQIRYLFSLRDERNYKPLSEVNLISVYTDKGVLQHSDIEQTTGNKAQNADGYKHVYKNDLVVNIILCWMGALGISDFDGVTSPAYDVYAPKDLNLIFPKYYHYLFRTTQFNGKCYTEGRGIMQMRWRTYSSEFKSIKVPLPPKATQQRIAEYLDSKCAQIDSIIEESKKSIEEYKAWKQSVIFEAVTGKNLNCKKKDSGIDTVGLIPIDWKTRRLRFLCDIMTGNQDTQDANPDGKYNFYVRSPNVERSDSYTFEGEGILMAGDGAGAGKVFHHAYGKYAIHQRVYCFYNFRDINTNFFYYYISLLFSIDMEKGSAQSTVPSVRMPMIKDFTFCLPPLSDQESIAKMLDSKCAQIDSLIAEKESLITDLTEYKKSLIFEVVTGKRSV